MMGWTASGIIWILSVCVYDKMILWLWDDVYFLFFLEAGGA